MSKFHISKAGKPVMCHATPGECPLGDMEHHYDTKEEAMHAIEESLAQDLGIMNPWMSGKVKKKRESKKHPIEEKAPVTEEKEKDKSVTIKEQEEISKRVKENITKTTNKKQDIEIEEKNYPTENKTQENKISISKNEETEDKHEIEKTSSQKVGLNNKIKISGTPEQIAKRPEIDVLVRQLPMSANGDITLKHAELISMVLSSRNIDISAEDVYKASKHVKRDGRIGEIQEQLINLSNKKGYKLLSLNGVEVVMGKEKDVAKHPIVSEVISSFSYTDENNKLYLEDDSAKMVFNILKEQGIDAGKPEFLKNVAQFIKQEQTKKDVLKMGAMWEAKRRDGVKRIMLLQELRKIEENNKWMRQQSTPLYY